MQFDKQAIKTDFARRVRSHIPKNATKWTARAISEPWCDTMVGRMESKPAEGKVVEVSDSAIIVKVGRIDFWLVDRSQVDVIPEVGDTIRISPYARRDFDGRFAYEGKEEKWGEGFTSVVYQFGGNFTKLPVVKPQCPYLVDLIEQLNELRAPDCFRNIAQLIADANGKDFALVDPADEDVGKIAPSISCRVSTAKFSGRVSVALDVGADHYDFKLESDVGETTLIEGIYFDQLGEVFAGRVDDGKWRTIRIELLKKAPKAKQRPDLGLAA